MVLSKREVRREYPGVEQADQRRVQKNATTSFRTSNPLS
jgi:hypothetical protein